MHDDHTMILHVFIGFCILWLDKFTPGFRADKERMLGAPVIMGQHYIRFDIINDQLHILETVFADGITEIHHIFRFQKIIHQHILEAHKKMKSFEYTGRHEGHNKVTVCADFISLFDKRLPESRIGAVCLKIRHHKLFLPFGDVADHLVFVSNMWHGSNLICRPQDFSTKTVDQRIHTRMTVATNIGCCWVRRIKNSTFILFYKTIRFSVRFDRFQKILFC